MLYLRTRVFLGTTAAAAANATSIGSLATAKSKFSDENGEAEGGADAASEEVKLSSAQKTGERIELSAATPTPTPTAAATLITPEAGGNSTDATGNGGGTSTTNKSISSGSNGNGGARVRPVSITPSNLNNLRVNAFFENGPSSGVTSIASGSVAAKIAGSVYAVHLQHIFFSPVVEVGSRVYVEYGKDEEHDGVVSGGIAVRVNGNGTLGILLDNNSFDIAVPPEMICMSEGRAKYVNDSAYLDVVEWIRSAGVVRRVDQESMACVLFQRGWRVDKLYLLEAADVHCMTFIPKSVRMSVLDKSEWQRDHHRQMRQLLKERVKERDFRYRLTKYSGVVSASMAFLGIAIAFAWNVKNYRRQQRKFQLSLAVKTLAHKQKRHPGHSDSASQVLLLHERTFVKRDREVNAVRQVLHRLDTAHPRIVVLTGFFGCGKSTVCRAAVREEGMEAVFVDIHGSEDTTRSIVKALGVQNVDVCGDLLDFVAEACQLSRKANGKTPLLVLKLREGNDLRRIYNESITLACDHRVCHLVAEVPLESLTMANTSLPRLDFYTVPIFNVGQAYEYTQHSIDPVSLAHFIEVVGTNSNDLDELFAVVHQRRVSPAEYTNQKLVKAMRHVQSACVSNYHLRVALRQLAAFPYEDGQHAGVDATSLRNSALRDIVLYDPVRDAWLFRSKLLHTAARSCII